MTATIGPGPTVAAVVVTHNRHRLLQVHLNALRAQTRRPDAIYAVDVASTDDTAEILAANGDVVHVRLEENVGGAGGFHAGIRQAVEDGFDWVWCGDDDGRPAEDALERLLDATSRTDAPFLNCLVASADAPERPAFYMAEAGRRLSTVQEVQETGLLHGGAAPFNGTLIDRRFVKRWGLPCPELFIWGDELEYYRRAARSGEGVFTVTNALYFHPPMPEVPPSEMPVQSFWKVYYGVRNAGARCSPDGRARLSPLHAGKAAIHLLASLIRDGLRGRGTARGRKIAIVIAAVLAACRNDLRRRYR